MKFVDAWVEMKPIGRLYVVTMFLSLLATSIYLKFGWQHPMTLVSMIYDWAHYSLYGLFLAD